MRRRTELTGEEDGDGRGDGDGEGEGEGQGLVAGEAATEVREGGRAQVDCSGRVVFCLVGWLVGWLCSSIRLVRTASGCGLTLYSRLTTADTELPLGAAVCRVEWERGRAGWLLAVDRLFSLSVAAAPTLRWCVSVCGCVLCCSLCVECELCVAETALLARRSVLSLNGSG